MALDGSPFVLFLEMNRSLLMLYLPVNSGLLSGPQNLLSHDIIAKLAAQCLIRESCFSTVRHGGPVCSALISWYSPQLYPYSVVSGPAKWSWSCLPFTQKLSFTLFLANHYSSFQVNPPPGPPGSLPWLLRTCMLPQNAVLTLCACIILGSNFCLLSVFPGLHWHRESLD